MSKLLLNPLRGILPIVFLKLTAMVSHQPENDKTKTCTTLTKGKRTSGAQKIPGFAGDLQI